MARSNVKDIIGAIVRFAGIPLLVRNTYAKNKVSIVLYHDPERDVFERHMEYLSKIYTFINLSDLVNAIEKKDWSQIPPKSLVVTFDDGHKGNFELLDVLSEYNVNPTVYVCTDIVATHRRYWWKCSGLEVEKMKKLENSERKRILLEENGFHEEEEWAHRERQAINLVEMTEMKQVVDFQSHTCFHPILTRCNDSECWDEIVNSKNKLESLIGASCKHFAYPNGDYSQREIEMLKTAGYSSARTIKVGWNDVNTNPYELNVVGVADDASINWMSVQMCGLSDFIKQYLLSRCWLPRPR